VEARLAVCRVEVVELGVTLLVLKQLLFLLHTHGLWVMVVRQEQQLVELVLMVQPLHLIQYLPLEVGVGEVLQAHSQDGLVGLEEVGVSLAQLELVVLVILQQQLQHKALLVALALVLVTLVVERAVEQPQ
jgi:hypothetical protein